MSLSLRNPDADPGLIEKPISIIVAMTKNRVIGCENKLPWHIPEDLKLFKQVTMGNIILMGRKTYDSIGKPLPGRKNFVVTRQASESSAAQYEPGKVYYFKSLEDAIQASFRTDGTPFIIGGASVYEQALPFAQILYISLIKKDYAGDTYFPEFNLAEWNIIEEKDFTDFTLNVYTRK
ncbi:MAG: dihydrofolate reductase [Spirochaetes bacterium]|nr:dihydrofolate reductase [Spirochaetota bacterium]